MKDKKNLIIVGLMICIFLLTVAYAAFAQSLSITGSGTITSTWGPIYIDSCTCVASAYGSAVPTATCTADNNAFATTASVSALINFDAKTPGDSAVCTITVKNSGTLHAASPTFSVTNSNNFTITGTDGTCIKANGNTGTFKANITYNASTTTAPSSVETLKLVATYKQGSC